MVGALLERFLAPCGTYHLGVDWSRCDGIGGYSIVGQFQRHRARQPDNSRLGDAVWRKVDRGHESRHRGERNDPPILALGHFARRRLRAVEGAERWIRRWFSQFSRVISKNGCALAMPALLIITSIRPNSRAAPAMNCWTWS